VTSLKLSKEITGLSWNGVNGPSTVESQELISDADTFKERWLAYYPDQSQPEVDFSAQSVVLLTAGTKPTGGYSVRVSNLEEKSDQLIIHFKVEAPNPDMATTQALTSPWSMQIIPKPVKPVFFQKDL
jgi:hypothetical protein